MAPSPVAGMNPMMSQQQAAPVQNLFGAPAMANPWGQRYSLYVKQIQYRLVQHWRQRSEAVQQPLLVKKAVCHVLKCSSIYSQSTTEVIRAR